MNNLVLGNIVDRIANRRPDVHNANVSLFHNGFFKLKHRDKLK